MSGKGLLLMAVAVFLAVSVQAGCKDQNGNSVDWFVGLKVPKLDGFGPAVDEGFAYFYMDANSPSLRLSPYFLNDTQNGAITHTVSALYTPARSGLMYVMYNDQDPSDKDHDTYAHSKGVLSADASGGYWLIHSVPHFPNFTSSGYNFPTSGQDNGQSFLCVSLSASTVNSVASLLLLNKPYVYDSNLPSFLSSSYGNVNSMLNGDWIREAKSMNQKISTVGGVTFTQFAKSDLDSQTYLYENVVAPYFQAGLITETWQNGATSNVMPSFCTPQYSYNVQNADTVGISPYEWRHTKDHSKWAVATDSSLACIGDINRQFSQAHRGGGTLCRSDASYASHFTSFVVNATTC